jgi:hypothetical protein
MGLGWLLSATSYQLSAISLYLTSCLASRLLLPDARA